MGQPVRDWGHCPDSGALAGCRVPVDPRKMEAEMARILYTAEATVTGGRQSGHGRTNDGALDVQLRSPKEMGGEGGGTNPEQLFAAGYAGCFHSSLKVAARGEGISLTGSEVAVTVGLIKGEGGFSLAVSISADLPGVSPEQGEKLMALAHQRCPYSKATRGNIGVQLRLGRPAEAVTR